MTEHMNHAERVKELSQKLAEAHSFFNTAVCAMQSALDDAEKDRAVWVGRWQAASQYADELREKLAALDAEVERLRKDAEVERLTVCLKSACERMDRARGILTDNNPRPGCNWGLLDTSDLMRALSEEVKGG